ncbi:MAG: flagellar hook-associated protein FlgK, partial [Acidimicrobiia bacterium]|nr:flagellar hook-associated protein FlgK [Acidimicrobiia bacterium]
WNAFDNGGLNRALLDLGTAFDNLVNNPELTANRVLALQAGETVAAEVRQAAADGRDLAVSLGERAATLVNRANALSTGIAALDDRIRSANAAGADAASLEDERDRLIDELVSITNASVAYDENGGVRVAIDGYPLVAGNRTSPLSAATVADPSLPAGLSRLVITAADGRELRLTGGDLRGTQQAANVLIPEQLRALDTFATDLAAAANAVHSAGEGADGGTGRNLFDAAAGALGFTVSADVAGSADRIAVAAAGVGGYDTTAAEQMASLIDAPDGPTTGWRNVVTNLAGLTAGTRIRADAAADAATSADQQRIAASGVSLDEEMTELIAAQRSYEASARVITTVDAMLDTLINRTGLVGR